AAQRRPTRGTLGEAPGTRAPRRARDRPLDRRAPYVRRGTGRPARLPREAPAELAFLAEDGGPLQLDGALVDHVPLGVRSDEKGWPVADAPERSEREKKHAGADGDVHAFAVVENKSQPVNA